MKNFLPFALIFAVLLLSIGQAQAQVTGTVAPGVLPSRWDHSQWHTMELNDYYSQTSDCQLFYERTAALRRSYYADKFDYNEELRGRGTTQAGESLKTNMTATRSKIEEQQPPRFSCPW